MQSLSHQFLAFCRSKPADEEYVYTSPSTCAFCQFLVDAGMATQPSVGPGAWNDRAVKGRPSHNMPVPVSLAVDGPVGDAGDGNTPRPWTFGALADRLEAALAA